MWTTFSPDQVDLNFRNERVLLRVVEILLVLRAARRRHRPSGRGDLHLARARAPRCAHLRETHALVKLFRAILDVVAPQVAIVTETNVPHADNIGYFGDGADEAQMVYNFALPPLVLHAFHRWRRLGADARGPPRSQHVSDTATYFNFLASHDGVGLLGARGILPDAEIDVLVAKVREHGGLVSYRDNGDGTPSPYELNVTWWSALNREDAERAASDCRWIDSSPRARSRCRCRGVPGIYLPSLFGARNDTQTALASKDNRSINRKTIQVEPLVAMLSDRRSWVRQVATRFRRLLKRRAKQPAFHPNADQTVLDVGSSTFALVRTADPAIGALVLVLVNVTPLPQAVTVPLASVGSHAPLWRDTLSLRHVKASADALHVSLRPYDILWLVPEPA